MEIASIKGEPRVAGGRHANERLRRRGLIPAVIYGHNKTPETVAMSLHDTELALQHMTHMVQLQIEGREQHYLIKDVQYDHLQQTPIHVDLMRVDLDERVQVKVALELKGSPKGSHEGGTLSQVLTEIEIECRALEIPDMLRIKIDHLGLGDSLLAKDVPAPPGVRVVNDPNDVIAVVHAPKGLTAAEEAEIAAAESAEPEVIGKGKEGEGEPGA